MKCGTRHGWDAHKARNEPPCKWCIKAVTAPAPVVRAKPGPKPQPKVKRHVPAREVKPRKVAECGTAAGCRRHYRANETPCTPCRDASAAHTKALRHAKYGAPEPRTPPPCGTEAGRARHKREGTMCDDCRDAYNAAVRRRRSERKAA